MLPAGLVGRLAALGGVPLVFALAMLSTYRAAVDGGWGGYARWTALAAAAAVGAYGLSRRWFFLRSSWPLGTLLVALALGGSFHALRLLHPVRRGLPLAEAQETFAVPRLDQRRWESEVIEPGSLALHGAAELNAPPGAVAWLGPRQPPTAWWLRGPARLWLPVGFRDADVAEILEWRARIERSGSFFILVDTDPVLVQATPYGAHVTTRPAGGQVAADELHAPPLAAPGVHEWRLRRAARVMTLEVDGDEVWRRGAAQPLGRIRFGETRPDPLHGGRLTLYAVRYARLWERTP